MTVVTYTYTDTDLINATRTYSYQIQSVDSSDNLSALSDPIYITTYGTIIYYTFTDDQLENATTYCYQIQAVDTSNNLSPLTDVLCVTTLDTLPPCTPFITAIPTSPCTVYITWKAAVDNVGVVAYDIYRDNFTTPITTTLVPNYTDIGLTTKTSYTYRIKARDASNNASDFSNTATATTLATTMDDTSSVMSLRPYRRKRELADWIRRKLGAPVVSVAIDSTQIDDAIDQACDLFAEHAGGIGNKDSILLISPELLYYDGTGKVSQPGPTKGKWRSPLPKYLSGLSVEQLNALTPDDLAELSRQCATVSSTGTTGTTGTNNNSSCYTTPKTSATTTIDPNCCPEDVDGPGPGFCGDNIQDPHCFTDSVIGDPTAIGPFWTEGDTSGKPSKNGYLFKTVYDVPTDIIAVGGRLDLGMFGIAGANEDSALFSPLGMMMQGGGSWGMMNSSTTTDNRWGFWMGSGSGFVDVVGWQLGMQYLEMFRQMFTVKMNVQFIETENKIIISPPPTNRGVIAIACTRRVAEESLYKHQWVREYAYALAMVQVGMNSGRYNNLTMPGGSSINFEMYLNRGDALRDRLEKQLWDEGQYKLPCDFFIG